MLSSRKFCGNGLSGRSETLTGPHLKKDTNSAALFLPGSSQLATLLLRTAG